MSEFSVITRIRNPRLFPCLAPSCCFHLLADLDGSCNPLPGSIDKVGSAKDGVLYRSLGGGWDVDAATIPATSESE